MSVENLLWGAPRIQGELLKLGFAVAQSTVAKYMIKRCEPSSQGWVPSFATMRRTSRPWTCSWFPTIGFNLLYVLVIVRLAATRACLDQRNTAPDGRMDRAPNHGGLPLE